MKSRFIGLAICCLSSIGFALGDEYTRKSVTFLDAVIIASPDGRKLSLNQIDYVSKSVKEKVQLSRFDFNPIPENSPLMQSFFSQINSRGDMSLEEIAGILNKTFVPQIVAIMDEYAEQRATGLVGEAAKMSFITTKAKDLGITAENLEQVFNSGFIYLPYINGYSRTVDSKKEDDVTKYTVTSTISGGIFWFKIKYTDGKTSVIPVVKSESSSIGVAVKKDYDDAESNAFRAAVQNYARNLENATKEYEEFKLSTSVAELVGSTVGFRMGKKEGLRIDDRFVVGEYMENSSGKLEFKQDGFMRIRDVADNRSGSIDLSHGYGVIVGDWGEGMSLVEYPRLNLDLYGYAGSPPLSTDDSNWDVSSSIGIGAEIAYNLGAYTQKTHTYITLGFMIGDATLEANGENVFDSSYRMLISSTFMKRFQFHRFDLYGLGGYAYQEISGTYKFNGNDFTDKNSTGSLILGGGLNYTVNIDLAAGIRFSYYTGSSDKWTEYDSDNKSIGDFSEPDIDYSGSMIAIQVIYAPPSLGFDPASALGNLIP